VDENDDQEKEEDSLLEDVDEDDEAEESLIAVQTSSLCPSRCNRSKNPGDPCTRCPWTCGSECAYSKGSEAVWPMEVLMRLRGEQRSIPRNWRRCKEANGGLGCRVACTPEPPFQKNSTPQKRESADATVFVHSR